MGRDGLHRTVLVCASSVLYVNKIQPCKFFLIQLSNPSHSHIHFPDVQALPSVLLSDGHLNASQAQELFALLRELASAHILLSIALIGIILLQCGKYYSVRLQERERNEEVDVRYVRRLRQRQRQERESGSARIDQDDVLLARAGAH